MHLKRRKEEGKDRESIQSSTKCTTPAAGQCMGK